MLVYKSPHPLLHFNGEDNTERAKHEVKSVFLRVAKNMTL